MYTNVFRGCNIENPGLKGFTAVQDNKIITENILTCIAISHFKGRGNDINYIAAAALAVYHLVQQNDAPTVCRL
jgi:hypothetical protein